MTDDSPLVSAVIPVYNGKAFIAEAIESVLAQTWKRLECIVVDDGSTDGTDRVLAAFGDKVRCVRGTNRGVAAARNAGARAARGEILAFLDADDAWEPAKTERQVALFDEQSDLGLVYCGLQVVDGEGRHVSFSSAPEPAAVLRNTLLGEPPHVGLAQTGLVPRQVFFASGGFDERLSTSADGDLVWRLAARFPIAAVPEPLTRYRRHPDQMHLDAALYAHDSKVLLRKAFDSNVLPPELKRLKRRAFTNRAHTLAYGYRETHRIRALAQVCCAFCLSPYRTTRWIAPSVRRRLRRPLGRR